jgi:hypothetical protein
MQHGHSTRNAFWASSCLGTFHCPQDWHCVPDDDASRVMDMLAEKHPGKTCMRSEMCLNAGYGYGDGTYGYGNMDN